MKEEEEKTIELTPEEIDTVVLTMVNFEDEIKDIRENLDPKVGKQIGESLDGEIKRIRNIRHKIEERREST